MYEAFYGFKEKPFSILPDPSFLYFSATHTMAYAMLDYGVASRAGFTVITGEVGCGKTTLVLHMIDKLGPDVRVGMLSNTHQNFGELLQWVLMAFGLPYEGKSKVRLLEDFNQFLVNEYHEGRRTILIIDEAQNLQPDTLEELRMLSNINTYKDQLLQLVLIGQPRLRGLLRRPDLLQFAQRVSSDYHLKPLSNAEAAQYLTHRMRVAGRDEPLFTNDATALLHRAARGVPRVMNVLADTILFCGFGEGLTTVDRGLVFRVVRDLARGGSVQLNHLYLKQQAALRKAAPAAAAAEEPTEPDASRSGAAVVGLAKDASSGRR